MPDPYDVIVIGMGPGGETVADRMLGAGRRVAVVERELIGGECGYWGCIPSKTLLRPSDLRGESGRAHGVREAALDWPATADHRDTMIRHLDDAKQVAGYEEKGATVLRGEARLVGPGRVEVDGQVLEGRDVIIATGSEPVVPPIPGLREAGFWTNREATTVRDLPRRAAFVGGGPVSIELAQFMRRFGVEVALVEGSSRILPREDDRVCELVEAALSADGIDVRLGGQASEVRQEGEERVVVLQDGGEVRTDVVVLNVGRRPRVADLGLETVLDGFDGHLQVDERCRVADGLWAVGDATGEAMFTHVAKYQGRVVVDNLLGRPRRASYHAVPRVVFCDPEVAAVGLTLDGAREQGLDVVESEVELPKALARPWTYEADPRGTLRLLADRDRRVLVGAWAVAPMASEWIHAPVTAIQAQVPIEVLLDTVAQFPTYSEGFLTALEGLELGVAA